MDQVKHIFKLWCATYKYKIFDYMLKLSEHQFLLSKMEPNYFYITVFHILHAYLVLWVRNITQ